MSVIDNDWLPVLSGEFSKEYYKKLYSFVKSEYASHTVYPAGDDVMRAFNLTPLSSVNRMTWDATYLRAVILRTGLSRECCF